MHRRIVFAASLAIMGSALLPAEARAVSTCKPAVSGKGPTTEAAVADWKAEVTNRYGAVWADYDLARNKTESTSGLLIFTQDQVTAEPCGVGLR
jgi:hypothetical protein